MIEPRAAETGKSAGFGALWGLLLYAWSYLDGIGWEPGSFELAAFMDGVKLWLAGGGLGAAWWRNRPSPSQEPGRAPKAPASEAMERARLPRPAPTPRRRPLDMQSIAAEITQEEGVRHEVYSDPLGLKTAGIGHLLTESDPEYAQPIGTPVSPERVEQWFRADLREAVRTARVVVLDFDRLPHEARAVLVSLAFNLGEDRLRKFRNMLDAIDARNWQRAAEELLDSKRARQLPARSRREADRLAALDGMPLAA